MNFVLGRDGLWGFRSENSSNPFHKHYETFKPAINPIWNLMHLESNRNFDRIYFPRNLELVKNRTKPNAAIEVLWAKN